MKHPKSQIKNLQSLICILLILSLLFPLFAEEKTKDKQHYIIVKEYKNVGLAIPAIGLAVWAGTKFAKMKDYNDTAELFRFDSPAYSKLKSKATDYQMEGMLIAAGAGVLFAIALAPVDKMVPVHVSMTPTSIHLSYNF